MRRFLELPVIPPRQCQRHHKEHSIIDYRNSIIVMPNDYIGTLEEIVAKKEAVQAKRQRKKKKAEHAKVEHAYRKAEAKVVARQVAKNNIGIGCRR
jgi:GH18 family chitinase